MRATKRIFN